jgi:peptide-methionine (R)-S-oxide reductase
MSRNRTLTILLPGLFLLFLEFVAAAPPAATETKNKKIASGEAAQANGKAADGKAPSADRVATADEDSKPKSPEKPEKVVKTDAEWRKILTPNQFRVTRKKWTEPAGTGIYAHSKKDGVYHCICCGEPLFDSKTKFESGTGWPSFFQPLDEKAVTEIEDKSDGTLRTEVECSRCDAHLGHVFGDGPQPTGLRYCMNSASLKFVDRKKEQAAKAANSATSKGAK